MSTPATSVRATTRGPAGLSGVLAAALTLAVGHLVAAVLDPATSPFVALGGAVVDRTPRWLKEFAAETFGTADKLVLFAVMALVAAALAFGVGVLAIRRPGPADAAVIALGVLCAVAAMSRPGVGALAPVPSLFGAGAGLLALHALVRRLPESGDDTRAPARRDFLRGAGVVAVLAGLSAVGGVLVSTVGRAASAAREALHLPAPAKPAAPLPQGVQSATEGVVDFVTPNVDFYRIDTALLLPDVDPEGWSLRVHGLVAREITLTWAELLASDLIETYVTLTCVSNPVGGDLVGNAKWLGLPIRDLLARADPLPEADMVLSRSVDGFTASTPIEVLTDSRDAILAVGMNDEPLPTEHGFPVRMVVPGLYGYVSATKWVTDLEVTRFADAEAYWTVRGWSEKGPIKTSSRIEVPRPSSHVKAGTVAVGGTAWAQRRGITGVEVQVDDGPWQAATLATEASVDTWRQWSYPWPDAQVGKHTLRARASDPEGVQDETVAPVVPDGASGWNTVYVYVD